MDFDAKAERMIIGLVPLTTEMTLKPLIAAALKAAYNEGLEDAAVFIDEVDKEYWVPTNLAEDVRAKKVP